MKRLLCLFTFLWLPSLPVSAQLLLHDAETLTAAATRGDAAGIAADLSAGVALEKRNEKGWTPLICAVHAGRADAVRFLLSKGANPNTLTRAGCAPIDFAVVDGFDDIVTALLDAHADPNGFRTSSSDGNTWSPLDGALHAHKPAQITQLLAHGARLEDRNPRGETALMEACKLPYVDQVNLLIEKGADVKVHTPKGQTPLMYAALNGRDETVGVLLAHGVDPRVTAIDYPGGPRYDAWYLATEQGHPYILEELADAGVKPGGPKGKLNQELNAALNQGEYERVQAALANGASATEPDDNNVLPLTVAVLQGDPAVMQLLIQAGADVNANPDGDPRTKPLAYARGQIVRAKTPQERERFQRVAALLEKAGATP